MSENFLWDCLVQNVGVGFENCQTQTNKKKNPPFHLDGLKASLSHLIWTAAEIYAIYISSIYLENYKVSCLSFPFSACKMCIAIKPIWLSTLQRSFSPASPLSRSPAGVTGLEFHLIPGQMDWEEQWGSSDAYLCGVVSFALFTFILISSSL